LHSFTDELIEESTVEFVAVDGQDRIIVSDSDGGRVLVYSVEGQRLVEFSSCGGPDGRDKMRPQGLAVDGSGNILVADQTCSGGGGGGRVLKFSPDGLLVDVVCEWNGQSERPWGVAYDETERRLAVASDSGLSVYRL
jgi:DNA-binding beta-propeller fold protein YncE